MPASKASPTVFTYFRCIFSRTPQRQEVRGCSEPELCLQNHDNFASAKDKHNPSMHKQPAQPSPVECYRWALGEEPPVAGNWKGVREGGWVRIISTLVHVLNRQIEKFVNKKSCLRGYNSCLVAANNFFKDSPSKIMLPAIDKASWPTNSYTFVSVCIWIHGCVYEYTHVRIYAYTWCIAYMHVFTYILRRKEKQETFR